MKRRALIQHLKRDGCYFLHSQTDSLFQLSDHTMEFKDYQQQALDTLDCYLQALKEVRQQADKAAAYLTSNDVPNFLIEQTSERHID